MQLRINSHPIDRWTAALFGLFAVVLIAKCSVLHFPNFIFTYPWISYDGYQWIADSLHYLDHNINATHRNPFLPLTFSFMRLVGVTDYFAWVLGALTFSFYVALYWLALAFIKPNSARFMVLWFFLVFRIHTFFDFILADPWAITSITAGLGCLVRLRKDPRYIIGAGAFFGISLNYQFAAGFMSPALIWYVISGMGIEWCKIHRKAILQAGILFLIIALPQFIYKWIAFGSPLYSHVTHFPLIRLHLFGLPGYFMNFFSFLGWPLALVVAAGVKRAAKERSAEWQLIHLTGTCMFIFWILCYLWLDIRFLLYLVPMWAVYAGYAIEVFSFQKALSFVGKTPFQKVLIICAVYVSASMSAYKLNAFDGGTLPLTPQTVLHFNGSPITEWQVATFNFHNYTTEYIDTDSNLLTVIKYQRYYRKSGFDEKDKLLGDDANQVGAIVRAGTSSKDYVGLWGELNNVFDLKMKFFNTLERNVSKCDTNTKYCVVRSGEAGQLDSAWKTVWSSQRIVLAERRS